MFVSFVVRFSKGREESRGEMDLNMSGVDVREVMCEMYCGVMVWFTRVGDVGGVAFCTNRAWGHPEGVNHVGSFRASY